MNKWWQLHNRFMKIIMKNAPLITSIGQAVDFLKTTKELEIKYEISSTRDKYEFIKQVKWSIKYSQLNISDRHHVLSYLKLFTHYSISHLKRLMKLALKGRLVFNPSRRKNKFAQKFFPTDIALLIKTDVGHTCLSGEATKAILVREYKNFGKVDYATISQISISHIYNIRNKNAQYNSSEAKQFKHTEAIQNNIGTRNI